MSRGETFIYRAGITALNAVTIIAIVIVVGSLAWLGWDYFKHPQEVLQNINGVLVRTAVKPTVRRFFDQVALEWRPVRQAAAAEGGLTIERYDSNLPFGPLNAKVFDDTVVSEPVGEPVETNGNTNDVNGNVNDNQNVNAETNTNENANANVNVNSSQNTNTNVNVNVDINGNTNSNQNSNANTNGNENTNRNQNQNENLNSNQNLNVNENANANVNANGNQNENTNGVVNVNANENTNTAADVNENDNANTNVPVDQNANLNGNGNGNTNASPLKPEVIPEDEWRKNVPRGLSFLQANWFCSAAYTHLFLVKPNGSTLALGDFTGDCTNPSVVVKGYFLPQALPDVDLSNPLNFRLVTEWYDGEHRKETATDPDVCTVDYIRGAGHRDVYAAQYTCDDGLGIGAAHNDFQFTVYAFPSSWTFPKEREDLFTADELKADADGDGFDLRRELRLGTNPNHWDTDTDNLGDFEEVEKYKTDPLVADTDGDGYKDYVEVNSSFNPLGSGRATAEQLAQWQAAPDQAGKPTITNVQAQVAGGNLTVSWDVTPAADGIVNFGPTDTYGTYRNNKAFLTHHAISYPVSAGQVVHYAIRSCTPAPSTACATTNDAVFTVP